MPSAIADTLAMRRAEAAQAADAKPSDAQSHWAKLRSHVTLAPTGGDTVVFRRGGSLSFEFMLPDLGDLERFLL